MTMIRKVGRPVSKEPMEEKFWERVDLRWNDECWPWLGAMDYTNGYGAFYNKNKKRSEGAHITSYEMFFGPKTEGMVIDHICNFRRCVNPLHLRLVTARFNTLRGVGATANNARKTQCPRGHEYTEQNTYYKRSRKGRECRTCISLRWKKS